MLTITLVDGRRIPGGHVPLRDLYAYTTRVAAEYGHIQEIRWVSADRPPRRTQHQTGWGRSG